MGAMERPFVISCLAAAALFLGFGVTLPLIEFSRLFVFSQTPSLIAMVAGLWHNGDRALAVIVAVASIGLPAVKITAMATEALVPNAGKRPLAGRAAHLLARWSMLDVLLVALLVFGAKTSGLASVTMQPGFWCFLASILFAALAGAALDGAAAKRQRGGSPDQLR